MHLSLLNSVDISLHLTTGLFLLCVLSDLLSTMLKTSGNTPTLQLTSPPSSLRNQYHNLIQTAKKHYY